ncbi:hypothetical protein DRJ48_03040 [Candidatus Woesearchaeota archaeon]|nr:MAG: hypothetical protein DRJ48_03040 [Candidatus Woesearchaeota archaeon]
MQDIPYFFVYKAQTQCFFAEVKLEHEPVRQHQLRCFRLLESYGFVVVLVRAKCKPYRLLTRVELGNGLKLRECRKGVLVRQ